MDKTTTKIKWLHGHITETLYLAMHVSVIEQFQNQKKASNHLVSCLPICLILMDLFFNNMFFKKTLILLSTTKENFPSQFIVVTLETHDYKGCPQRL